MAKRMVIRSATAAAAALSVVAMASAQDSGGELAVLTLSQGLRWTDNSGLTPGGSNGALEAVTSLGLRYDTTTKASRFSASTNAALTYNSDTGKLDLSDPALRLSLGRSNRDATIDATLSFSQSQVSRSQLGDEFDSSDLSLSTGTLRRGQVGLSGEFGKTRRVGVTYGVTYSARDYSDVTGDNLFDNWSGSAQAGVRMTLTPTMTANLDYTRSRSRTDSPTGNDVDGHRLSARITANIDKATTVNAGLSYGITDRTPTAGGATSTTRGLGYTLAVNRTLRGGSLGAQISGSQTTNGLRTSVSVNRTLTTKTGELALSFGAVQTGSLGWDPLVSLSYTHELKRGNFSVDLSQRAVTNSDEQETLQTRVRASYSQTLTRNASLSAGVSVADVRGISGGAADSRRSTFDLSYRHALAQDWDLVGGYSLLHSTRSTRDDVTANTVFVRVEKQFDWRP